ncbi:MAG: ABC transporter ATP-binding protein [Chloroflexota bacterium]
MLRLARVSLCYNHVPALKDVDLLVESGETVGLLGPNGSGKTTMIKLACGVLRPSQGEVFLHGSRLDGLRRRVVAREVAVVPQQFFTPFAFTLREVVFLGRTPFLKAFADDGKRDGRAVDRAMELVGIDGLGQRYFNELSGGERQKGVLAMALAQEPSLLLMDEPTAHLDINYQVEILELVRRLNRERGITVIAAMHDLNLAALYFGRLLLLKDGTVFADGRPEEVLTEETIHKVFSASVQVMRHPSANVPHVMLNARKDPH